MRDSCFLDREAPSIASDSKLCCLSHNVSSMPSVRQTKLDSFILYSPYTILLFFKPKLYRYFGVAPAGWRVTLPTITPLLSLIGRTSPPRPFVPASASIKVFAVNARSKIQLGTSPSVYSISTSRRGESSSSGVCHVSWILKSTFSENLLMNTSVCSLDQPVNLVMNESKVPDPQLA